MKTVLGVGDTDHQLGAGQELPALRFLRLDAGGELNLKARQALRRQEAHWGRLLERRGNDESAVPTLVPVNTEEADMTFRRDRPLQEPSH